MLGDSRQTLSLECHAQLEAEANYAAGQLLFLQGQFVDQLSSSPINIDTLRTIAKTFGNTITTTLWRAIEQAELPCVGFVSQHPRRPSDNFDPANPCRYFIRSRTFAERFAGLTETRLFAATRHYCGHQRAGHLGSAELVLVDTNGHKHIFAFETFHNSYEALTLGVYKCSKPHVLAV